MTNRNELIDQMALHSVEADWTDFPIENFYEIKEVLKSPSLKEGAALSDADAWVLLGKYAFTFGINEVDAVNEDAQHPNTIDVYPWADWNSGERSPESAWVLTYDDIKDMEMLDFQEFFAQTALRSVEHPERLFQPTMFHEKVNETTIDIRDLMNPQKREETIHHMTDFLLRHDMDTNQIDNLFTEIKMEAINRAEKNFHAYSPAENQHGEGR